MAPGGIVEVTNAYVALSDNPTAFACFHVHDGLGSVIFTGGQALCLPNSSVGGDAIGFYAENQTGVVVSKLAIRESKPPLGCVSCINGELTPEIENLAFTATQDAVVLGSSSMIRVAPKVSGASGVFPAGVELAGTTNSRVEVDWTRIEDATVGSNRLKANGASVTTAGPSVGGIAQGA